MNAEWLLCPKNILIQKTEKYFHIHTHTLASSVFQWGVSGRGDGSDGDDVVGYCVSSLADDCYFVDLLYNV